MDNITPRKLLLSGCFFGFMGMNKRHSRRARIVYVPQTAEELPINTKS